MCSSTARIAERGGRHHDGATVGDLCQATGDVAAQLDELEVRSHRLQLSAPTHGAGGDRRTVVEVHERPPHQHIGRVTASRERTDREGRVGQRGQILGRMHGRVCSSVEHGRLHLFDEDALAADLMERNVLTAIPRRLDEHQLAVDPGGPERGRDRFGLGPRLWAPPSGQAEGGPLTHEVS